MSFYSLKGITDSGGPLGVVSRSAPVGFGRGSSLLGATEETSSEAQAKDKH